MFKLGMISDQISMDFEKSLKLIKEMGLDYVEIHSMWDKNIEELDDDEINKARDLLKKYGLRVSNISSSAFLQCSLRGEDKNYQRLADYFITISGDYSFHLNALEHCMELAEIFDTDKVRIFGFEREDSNLEEDQVIEIVSDKLIEPVNLAEKNGVILTLENCPFTYMNESILVKRVIENIGSNNLMSLWDPGNLVRVEGKNLTPFPDEYNIIKNYIAHIHAKDVVNTKPGEAEQIVPIGDGDVDYEGILKSLKEDGFDGVLSMEPELFSGKEGEIKEIKKSLTNMNRIYSSLY